MSALIFDIDGTLTSFKDHKPLPGAFEMVNRLYDDGHRIIITTRRGDVEFKGHPVYSKQATYAFLRLNELKYHDILFDVPSPRVVINDDGAYAINVTRDSEDNAEVIANAVDNII